LNNTKIIDLGADFRLSDVNVYKNWYEVEHNNEMCLSQAVYGLCELHRDKIKTAQLIANPGCYTTCSILSTVPLLKDDLIEEDSIIVDAKSGVSGAGRSLNLGVHYNECNESIKAYKIASHRHTPEIEQELSLACGKDIKISFTPHLTPMNRGILATIYAKLKRNLTYEDVKKTYEKYYANEHFIRLTKKGVYPETRWVKGSNFVDIGFTIDERTNRIIVVGAIDNLVKGAAGQAVQNMNIMFELEESLGINQIPMFPI
jgi:N-acetyl-gamma-glutamyl-phosphate reductase